MARSLSLGCHESADILPGVELTGDPEGIAALKAIHTKNRDYLKFLIGEIRSNTDLRTVFKGDDGSAWHITLDPKSNKLDVQKKA
jgi:hypothetical protein